MNCRNDLFGISILWIMAFHIYGNVGVVGFEKNGHVANLLY